MNIKENKQYDFICIDFNVDYTINSSLFLYRDKIYITSFVNNKKFSKHVFNTNYELIAFENYFQENIYFNDISILKITNLFSNILKDNKYTEKELNSNLLKEFNIVFEPFVISRSELSFSFYQYEFHQLKHNKAIEKKIYKQVNFNSKYASLFNKYEHKKNFYLNLFKDNNTYWYCIQNSTGDAISKFIFELKVGADDHYFHLIQLEHYMENSHLIDFNELIKDFHNFHGSYEMHLDYPDDKISQISSCTFSFLYKVFLNTTIPLLFKD